MLRLDASDVHRSEVVADQALQAGGKMVAAVERRLKQAALEERFTHRYQNQTGHLQQSTAAVVVSETDNEIEVHLEIGEEYASYVVDRGFSDFEDIAAEAFADIDSILIEALDDL